MRGGESKVGGRRGLLRQTGGGWKLASTERERRMDKRSYRMSSADIFGAMDIDDFRTESFANIGACGYKLAKTIDVL